MGSLSLNILVGSVITGPNHHRNRGWRAARKDYYRAGCLMCSEASALALALEETNNLFWGHPARRQETGLRSVSPIQGSGQNLRADLAEADCLISKESSLEARFPCWRTSPFKKGSSGSISVCKITPGLKNQPLASRKQSQFKVVSAVSMSPFFFIHSSVLREIMCRLFQLLPAD